MLALIQPDDYRMPRPDEQLCFAQLQPVIGLGTLITTSTDLCLPECDFTDGVSCVEYVIQTEAISDQSPESLAEEELTLIQGGDLLQTRLTEASSVCEDEDDDASVILDFTDLSFLDQELTSDDLDCVTEPSESFHVLQDSLDNCQTIVVGNDTDNIPNFSELTPVPSPPVFSPTSTQSTHSTSTSSDNNNNNNNNRNKSPATTSSWSFHCREFPDRTITIIDARTNTITTSSVEEIIHVHPLSPLLSSPDSTSSASEMVSVETMTSLGSDGEEGSDMMDCDHVSENDDDDDDAGDNVDVDDECEEADYKPYCDSRRGAKKNLLWKFLLSTLDHHSDIVRWTDVQKGVFKFVDTARISSLWGQRKQKPGMTFEKLSRGIRHYYKRGLMQRQANTRLVYKFNWDKVPKRYRKA